MYNLNSKNIYLFNRYESVKLYLQNSISIYVHYNGICN